MSLHSEYDEPVEDVIAMTKMASATSTDCWPKADPPGAGGRLTGAALPSYLDPPRK